MLKLLHDTLELSAPFDSAVWALAACAFWGLMRFGEVSVLSQKTFDGSKHLKQSDAFIDKDFLEKPYARLDLPSAKTAQAREIQSVFVTEQEGLCPIAALRNMSTVSPAGPEAPLFSWCDHRGSP